MGPVGSGIKSENIILRYNKLGKLEHLYVRIRR